MYKVSLIIPVYNAEKYLKQCIRSALNQTLREIEIICLNDASTDSSLQILEDFAKEDCRVKIINKVNTGYGNTMNIGIDLALGKYIVFLESDDFIKPDMCKKLYWFCEEYELDMIKTDFYEVKSKGNGFCSKYKKVSDYDNYHKVLTPIHNTELFYASMYTWTCMYNRHFINKNKIRHHETPGASYQDNGFWFQTLMHCKKLYLLDQAFYMYRQDNPESSIHCKGNVKSFSKEYSFIRRKIKEYGKNQATLFKICAFFNIHHNLNSLKRVGKEYTEELIKIILNDFEENNRVKGWNVNDLEIDFLKKIMICKTQPEELRERVWKYIDKVSARNKALNRFDTYILYGAGRNAYRTLAYLEKCEVWNKNILCGVSNIEENGYKINGIEIKPIEELLKYKDKALIFVCARRESENYKQMCNNLEKWEAENIVHVDDLVVESFWSAWILEE